MQFAQTPDLGSALQPRIIFKVRRHQPQLAARRVEHDLDRATRHARRDRVERPRQQMPVGLGNAVLGQDQVAEQAGNIVAVDFARCVLDGVVAAKGAGQLLELVCRGAAFEFRVIGSYFLQADDVRI